MTTPSASLADVPAIIDRLEKSRFNYLDLQWGDLRITLGEQAHAPRAAPAPADAPAPAPALAPAPAAANTPASAAVVNAQAAPAAPAAPAASFEGTPIKAPMVGRFYAHPEPGAAPFVKVGDRISADTTIGLIEVMKVFNAVSAGVAGQVTALAVAEGEFVEFDQPLAYVRA